MSFYDMDNYDIINKINKIVEPYWKFDLDDFYKGGLHYPKIEELSVLIYKKNYKIDFWNMTEEEENIMVEEIRKLNVGKVEMIKIRSLGKYILVSKDDS
jgi:general stress protein 26